MPVIAARSLVAIASTLRACRGEGWRTTPEPELLTGRDRARLTVSLAVVVDGCRGAVRVPVGDGQRVAAEFSRVAVGQLWSSVAVDETRSGRAIVPWCRWRRPLRLEESGAKCRSSIDALCVEESPV